MASIKNHRPSEQTKTNNDNERSFTNKVKEMARSARKIFTHQHHPEFVANNHKQNFPSTGTAQYGVKTEEQKKIKKPVGSVGNCMPKMREHVKNLKNKKHREDSHTNNSSSSDSDDEKKSKRKN